MTAFLIIVAYLTTHFIIYAACLRERKTFCEERGILLYNAASVIVLLVVLLAMMTAFPSFVRLPHFVLAASLHAIYSISFLELWALADGGYSLSILDSLDANDVDRKTIFEELEQLGATKERNRIFDLVRLGLIKVDNDVYSLSSKGRLVARLISVISRIANVPDAR